MRPPSERALRGPEFFGVRLATVMRKETAAAIGKTGAIATGYFSAWLYRCYSHGESLFSTRVQIGAVLLFASFTLALAWQATSKVKRWSWLMTFIGFNLSLVVLCIAVASLLQTFA